jgi:hypothetical protein
MVAFAGGVLIVLDERNYVGYDVFDETWREKCLGKWVVDGLA